MILRKNPVKAPRNASVIERLLKVRRPWPVRRNPVYAIATVQRIARTFMGPSHPVEFTILSQLARVAERCLKGNLSDGNLHISYTRRMTVPLSSAEMRSWLSQFLRNPAVTLIFHVYDASEPDETV